MAKCAAHVRSAHKWLKNAHNARAYLCVYVCVVSERSIRRLTKLNRIYPLLEYVIQYNNQYAYLTPKTSPSRKSEVPGRSEGCREFYHSICAIEERRAAAEGRPELTVNEPLI